MIDLKGIPQRSGTWTWFKAIAASKSVLIQYDESDIYFVYGYDLPEVLTCLIWKGTVPTSVVVGGYTQEQNDEDKADFEANYKPTANRSMRTQDGRQRIAVEKPDLSRATIISHDWTDETTWYTTAVRVVAEVAADSGNHLTYNLDNPFVIDTYHGKLYGEDYLVDADAHSYRVVVKVNGTTKTEQDPHLGTGGDYTVNYVDGKIVFLSALDPADEVTVTYHKMVDSLFILAPTAGKRLVCDMAEVQFSSDVVLEDTTVYQAYGYVDVFAPQLMPGVPSGTKIPIGDPVVYKTIRDYQADAVKSYPVYPAMGGSGWRGLTTTLVIMDWDYLSATVLRADAGMEIRIKLQHDKAFGGTYSSATFYCTSVAL